MPGRHNASSIAGGAPSACPRAAGRAELAIGSASAATHHAHRTTRAGIFGENPIEIPKINVSTVGQHNTSSVQGGVCTPDSFSALQSARLQPQKRLALTRAAATLLCRYLRRCADAGADAAHLADDRELAGWRPLL